MNGRIIKDWEKRSLYFKDALKGVMLASFPDFVNNLFHNWEVKILRDFFPKNKKTVSVLDIGCGYGRLSFALSKQFQNAEYYGVDISKEYVKLFNKKLKGKGKAILASADNLPYKEKMFDFIFIVTVLIYMEDEEISKLVQRIREIANKDTVIVVIENNRGGRDYISGFGLQNIFRCILRRDNKHEIKCRDFKDKEIEKFFENDFFLKEKRKCRLLTLFLPFYFLVNKFKQTILRKIKADINIPFLPSLFTAHIFKVKANR